MSLPCMGTGELLFAASVATARLSTVNVGVTRMLLCMLAAPSPSPVYISLAEPPMAFGAFEPVLLREMYQPRPIPPAAHWSNVSGGDCWTLRNTHNEQNHANDEHPAAQACRTALSLLEPRAAEYCERGRGCR